MGPQLLVDEANIYSKAKFKLQHLDNGGLYGFIRMVNALVDRHGFTRVILCEERGGASRRRALDPEYKGDRGGGPIFEADHLEKIREWAWLSGYDVAAADECEADDVIAHIARTTTRSTTIFSADHDFFQLLSWNVNIIRDTSKGIYRMNDFELEYGISPKHYLMLMSLTGDGSDNVKGIPRVGDVTAAKILRECNFDWQQVLEHPKVKEHQDTVQRNKLVLAFHRPSYLGMLVGQHDMGQLNVWYAEHGMPSLVRQNHPIGTP